MVDDAVVAKKLVVVAFVPVALMNVKFCSVDDPEISRLDADKSDVIYAFVPLSVVAKSVVEVEFVVVELIPVKFCKVEEPVARRLATVRRDDIERFEVERLAE